MSTYMAVHSVDSVIVKRRILDDGTHILSLVLRSIDEGHRFHDVVIFSRDRLELEEKND